MGLLTGDPDTRNQGRKELLQSAPFILPSLIGFTVFFLLPLAASLVISMCNWDAITAPGFVGFANYGSLLRDPQFWAVMRNTAYYVLGVVPVAIAFPLLIAMGFNNQFRGMSVIKAVYFLPSVVSMVAAALVWKWMFNPSYGIINEALRAIGVPERLLPGWLASPSSAIPSLILMQGWKIAGYNAVIFLAGLKGIPKHLYEAASIDGANGWRRFISITIPMLSPTTFFVLVITIINSAQVFDQVFVMTQGGPADATNTIVYFIYQYAFQRFKMGYASAAAWILFAAIFGFTLLQFKYQREWVHYE